MQEQIRLSRARITNDGEVRTCVDASPALSKYLRQPSFFARYDRDVSLHTIPESVLLIPAVANLITLAWATGAALHVPTLDRRFVDSLSEVASAFQEMYPPLKTREARLAVDQTETCPARHQDAEGMLFTGGIDSTDALLEHADEVTHLFSIWGAADISITRADYWYNVHKPSILENPLAQGRHVHLIKSNLTEFLDQQKLNYDLGSFLGSSSWWAGLQHGLGLLALTAPVTYQYGIGRVWIASGLSASHNVPWASTPEIDRRIAWANTSAGHAGYGRARQAKIGEMIAPYIRSGHKLTINSCWQATRGSGTRNCGVCEKCVRTQVALLLEGIDPNDCGFAMTESTLPRAIRSFERNRYFFREDEIFKWSDVKRRIPQDLEQLPDIRGSRSFFEWLRGFDPESYASTRRNRLRAHLLRSDSPSVRLVKQAYRVLPRSVQHRVRRYV